MLYLMPRHRKSRTSNQRLHCAMAPGGATAAYGIGHAEAMRFASDAVEPPSSSSLHYTADHLVAPGNTTVEYGLIPPETLYGTSTCAHHRTVAACWSEYGDGHLTYCPCNRQRRPTGGDAPLDVGGSGSGATTAADGAIVSPPDVAVSFPIYDVGDQQQQLHGGRMSAGVYGVHGQTTGRHQHRQHHQQMVTCDKMYQDRLAVCKYSTFVGNGGNNHGNDGGGGLDGKNAAAPSASVSGHGIAATADDSTTTTTSGFGGSAGVRPPVSL
jgi:hypothetical protein